MSIRNIESQKLSQKFVFFMTRKSENTCSWFDWSCKILVWIALSVRKWFTIKAWTSRSRFRLSAEIFFIIWVPLGICSILKSFFKVTRKFSLFDFTTVRIKFFRLKPEVIFFMLFCNLSEQTSVVLETISETSSIAIWANCKTVIWFLCCVGWGCCCWESPVLFD